MSPVNSTISYQINKCFYAPADKQYHRVSRDTKTQEKSAVSAISSLSLVSLKGEEVW